METRPPRPVDDISAPDRRRPEDWDLGFRSLAKTIHTTTPTRRLVFHLFGAPVASWPLTGNGSIRWSEITYMLKRKPRMDHAKMFGLRCGVCFAINEDNHKSLLMLSHKEREFTHGEIAAVHAKFITWHSFVNPPVELTEDGERNPAAVPIRLEPAGRGQGRGGVRSNGEAAHARANAKIQCKSRRKRSRMQSPRNSSNGSIIQNQTRRLLARHDPRLSKRPG